MSSLLIPSNASITQGMISVVQELHGKGTLHGDIKPANMLLCSDGQMRLCDFAEARPRMKTSVIEKG
jgi:serine/threonine protein kinase